jgi:sarcosine oxidase subunit beta
LQKTADVVIIGGGVSGTSIAYYLAERGVKKIALLERENIATGSTGKSAGIITHYFSDAFMTDLELKAGEILKTFQEQMGAPIDYTPADYLYLLPHSEMLHFKKTIALYRQKAIPIEELSMDEIERMSPALTAEGVGIAAIVRDAAYADAPSVARGYAQAAEQKNVTLLRGLGAVGIKTRSGRVQAVVTVKGEIETEIVVNAAGPWAKAVGLMAGIDLPLTLLRHQAMLFRPPFKLGFQVSDLVHKVYFRPQTGGYMLVSGGEEDDELIETPDYFNQGADTDLVADLGARVTTRIPAFAESEYMTGWAGLLDRTPDWYPLLGRLPGVAGFYAACGFFRHGFHLAPVMGLLLAELIADGKYKTADGMALGIERFQRGLLYRRSFLDT